MHHLPATGYLRLPHIIVRPQGGTADPRGYPGLQEHLVGRRQIGPLSPTCKNLRAAHHGMARGGHSRPDLANRRGSVMHGVTMPLAMFEQFMARWEDDTGG